MQLKKLPMLVGQQHVRQLSGEPSDRALAQPGCGWYKFDHGCVGQTRTEQKMLESYSASPTHAAARHMGG